MNLRAEIAARISAALAQAGADAGAPALVAPAARPEFGDYQANGAMPAAKTLRTNPRELAGKVIAAAELDDLAENVEVAGPGFINIRLRTDWLAAELTRRAGDDRLGTAESCRRQTVVVDYSAPNLAKEMHVGHLRSTIIGDALARTLEFLGHAVIRQNHVGDWGTQFGMLVAHLKELLVGDRAGGLADAELNDLEAFYRKAKSRFDEDDEFADAARKEVVDLQAGRADTVDLWRRFRDVSLRHCQAVYEQLGVTLGLGDLRGESAYNDDLSSVVADLASGGLLTDSQGAQCVFLEAFRGKDGEITPFIVRKSDGGYLYATTDLAAIRHRAGELRADRVLYVVDARQSLHFRQLFAVARAAGFAPEPLALEHVAFGTMMGSDGRPFKTRTGGTVKLMDLLDEAEKRAFDLVSEKSPELPEPRRREIAHVVGIGAVKYADLAQNRTSDYVFSWDKMLSLEGNTAPYMQYAYARVRSIFRKGEVAAGASGEAISLAEPAERALGVKLAQFPETLDAVARECLPNVLCGYLFDLAGAFMGFYESCPVLKADAPETRASRLALCGLTAETIRTGLGLLGIETLEQM